MSKIGRKLIDTDGVQVELKGQDVHYKGSAAQGVYTLPSFLSAELTEDKKFLKIFPKNEDNPQKNMWGLHRALLANEIRGAAKPYEINIKITGLGYKAQLSGRELTFSLGYSHKIKFPLPGGIEVQVDKSGQNLTVKGSDKELVGKVAGKIRALRPTEPYKGTGIKLEDEVVLRKAGKAKA